MKDTWKKILCPIFFVLVLAFFFAACDDKIPPAENQTPVSGDYIFGNLSQTAGSVTAVTVTANNGKSPGAVGNIRYNNSTSIPQTAGTYGVTFDVAAADGWNARTNLSAGNLIVIPNGSSGITTYTVTFNSKGGSAVTASTGITPGSTITLPTPPTKADNTFAGWYMDDNTFSNEFTASTPVTINITIYAKWEPALPVTITIIGFNETGYKVEIQIRNYTDEFALSTLVGGWRQNINPDGESFDMYVRETGERYTGTGVFRIRVSLRPIAENSGGEFRYLTHNITSGDNVVYWEDFSTTPTSLD